MSISVESWADANCTLESIMEPAQTLICAVGEEVVMSLVKRLAPPRGHHRVCSKYGWMFWGCLRGVKLVQIIKFKDPTAVEYYLSTHINCDNNPLSVMIIDQTDCLAESYVTTS